MIHGGAASIGCVAIGDEPIEELFWLVATVGMEKTELLFAPNANVKTNEETSYQPRWLIERYAQLHASLIELKIASQ